MNARPRLATVEDVQQAKVETHRRMDMVFGALLLLLLGIVAGVGWVLIKSGDDTFAESCRMMQARDRVGAESAAAQARRDDMVAAWHAREGRRDLARVVGQASASERRLAKTRAKFAAADCKDLKNTPAIPGDAP
jgi:hypothetical protein